MCCGLQRKAHFFYILEFLWVLVLFALTLTCVIAIDSSCMSNAEGSRPGIFVILLIYLVYASCYLIYSFSYCAVIFTDYAKKKREAHRAQENPEQSKDTECINTCCFVIFYGLLKIFRAIIIFIKFFDFTQLFQWCIKSYMVTNIIEFGLKTLMYLFLLSINIASTIIFEKNGCKSIYPIQIVCLIWLTIKYFFTCFYFIHFTLYRPSFLDKDEKPAKEHARFMRIRELGISLCHSGDYCLSVDLQHILRNHNKLNIPTKKCNPWYYCAGKESYLIGFHQTTVDAALKIACTGFRPGSDGMFGGGIYFARSIDHTFGKAHFTGAFICALIDMGRMKTISKADRTITLQKLNREGFDSVYAKAGGDLTRDEFIVYSSDRVKKWIICIP